VIGWNGLLAEYAEWFDLDGVHDIVTLQEGNTPLIHADRLSERLEADVWLKYEGLNPSGSFKDRGMTMAITKAKANGAKTVICGSTGNTSAAAAAYAAKAGMDCVVLVPEGKIALGKLAQAIVYGAKVLQIRGNFDQALNLARELTQHLPITIVNSINPDRIEGQKTGAFEIVDVLGKAPDILSIPGGQRRQHHRLLAGLHAVPLRGARQDAAQDVGVPGRRGGPDRARASRWRTPRRSRRPSALATRRVGCPRSK
jgi:threonine synthase